MKDFIKRHITTIVIVALLVGWTFFIYNLSPTDIIDQLGVGNGYLVALLMGFFGGLSTFVAIPYYLIVALLGSAGLNPYLLGVAAGSGVFLGDSTSYLVGYKGRDMLSGPFQKISQKVSKWVLNNPRSRLTYLLLFLWGAVVPLPNDIVVITLGLLRYPYWKVMLPLGLGNIVFNILAAFIGRGI